MKPGLALALIASIAFSVAPAQAKSAKRKAPKATPTPAPAATPGDPFATTRELLKIPARPARPALPPSAVPLAFLKGERVAFVGGTFGERMNLFGHFETLLHSRFGKLQLVVRNFSRPADEVGQQIKPSDYVKLDDPLAMFGADTYLCFFGYNESFAGAKGVAKFKESYGKYLDSMAKTYPRDDTQAAPRFVLVSPTAVEGADDGFLPDGKKENANLKLYAAAVAEVAQARALAFVELFADTEALFAQEPGLQFTVNGAHQNEAGDREVAALLDRALFQTTSPAKPGAYFDRLRAAVNDKSWVHLQDYRMLNGWYVYGGRRTLDMETFPREFAKIRKMAEVRDKVVWAATQGWALKPDDSRTGVLFTPKGGFGTKPTTEPAELKYLTPEESIAAMKVPEGFEVQLVASEREFPQLAKPDQINFDNRGRLWVSCMPTYPQWKPGDAKPSDRLLIFDDFDATGRARKMTVFYDKLACPTGFEFWNGGVLVMDEPRMLWLKDTDGDDKADVVVQLSDGWATDDTHHTIGAFEWSHGGLLQMLEGVSLTTSVETPWGPLRRQNASGNYILDPRTQKLRHYNTPGYGNPWCYVFNEWGQGFVGDGTTPQQHWDSPLSGAEFPGRKGLNTIFDGMGMRPNVGNEFIVTRQFPPEVQRLFVYACVNNMHGLTTFSLGDDGAGYHGKRRTRDGQPWDLLDSDDKNFRPADPQIGPDGALYFADWHTALLGHMQYSQRDPHRDHSHGRVYRLVAKGRPLLTPVTQAGKSAIELLDQLKEYEWRTRYRARRELRDRNKYDVLVAVKEWVAKNGGDDRLLTEALWAQQGQHAVDLALAARVLKSKTGDARAAAVRVLSEEQVPGFVPAEKFIALVRDAASDDFARTRLEVIRALSFIASKESVELALTAATAHPRDYWIDYTLDATLSALEGVWKTALKTNSIAANNAAGLALLNAKATGAQPTKGAAEALKKLIAGAPTSQRPTLLGQVALGKGNAEQGKAIARRICIACHKFGAEGIAYGPDFAGVGTRLKREEIIDSILEPNAKVDPKFAITNLELAGGEAMTGFIAKETADTISFTVPGGLVRDITKTDVKKRETLRQSSMPEGLAATMSPQEFLDLVEFLVSLKK
ncbi:MAG: heme-binding protein [Chthoniobacteraceae bacterium]